MTQEVSFAELYRTHYRRVFGLCRQLLGNRDHAEDATQEVFMRAHRAFASYDPKRPFSGWILKIASNYCVDLVRRRAKETELFGNEPAALLELESDRPSVVGELIAEERAEKVKDAIEKLPEKYRIPLVLAYHGDSSYDDIATTLGVTRNHVGVLILRGKRQLRQLLSGVDEENQHDLSS